MITEAAERALRNALAGLRDDAHRHRLQGDDDRADQLDLEAEELEDELAYLTDDPHTCLACGSEECHDSDHEQFWH